MIDNLIPHAQLLLDTVRLYRERLFVSVQYSSCVGSRMLKPHTAWRTSNFDDANYSSHSGQFPFRLKGMSTNDQMRVQNGPDHELPSRYKVNATLGASLDLRPRKLNEIVED